MRFAAYRDDDPAPGSGELGGPPLPHLARSILTTVLTGYLLLGFITIWSDRTSVFGFAIEALFMAGAFATQYANSSSSAPAWRPGHKTWALLTQGLCTFTPLVAFRQGWGGSAGLLAGSCLLLVDGWAAWALFTVAIALVALSSVYAGIRWVPALGYTGSTFFTGLVVYGLSRLSNMVAEVHSAREEMARMAVVKERLRIASDLHDLLGYSLSAIALKGELARRLIIEHPQRALTEIHSVLEISRQALSDIRTVAEGYRDMSLAAEAASAQDILTAADVKAMVSIECGPLPKAVATFLATALREGVTNMLRHGDVQTCNISVVEDGDAIRLEVVNDGVRPLPAEPPARVGTGLESIARRAAALGGSVSTTITDDGWFHLVVTACRRLEKGGCLASAKTGN